MEKEYNRLLKATQTTINDGQSVVNKSKKENG